MSSPTQVVMSKLVALSLFSLSVLAGCDQSRTVGDLPGAGKLSGELRIENFVARVARSYSCAAGILEPFDSTDQCSCDETYSCDSSAATGSACVCDPECIQGRPMIACADYAATFVLENGTAQAIDRMTDVKMTIGQLVVTDGGLDCDADEWTVASGKTGGIIEVGYEYDAHDNPRAAFPELEFTCAERTSNAPIDGSNTKNLSDPQPPAITEGSVLLEIHGLYRDGSSWSLSASAEL